MTTEALKRISSVRVPQAIPTPAQGLWKSILEGAARTAEFDNSTLLILGTKDAGKASLIRELQKIGAGNYKLSPMELYGECNGVAALDYAYMNVRVLDDPDLSESLAKCNIWILQDPVHKNLLTPLLSPIHLKHLVVTICLDLSEPWALQQQLREWFSFATDLLQELFLQLPIDEQDALRSRLNRYISTYRNNIEHETKDEMNHSIPSLDINLGIPFVVCVCKSDAVQNLDTRTCPGRADALLAYLRALCRPYGAAVCYCCSKDAISSRNLDVLYRYCLHRIYDFKFDKPLTLEPPDAVFVPAGWDTDEEIESFAKTTVARGLEVPLESLIPQPMASCEPTEGDDNILVPSMMEFLQSLLDRNPSLLQEDTLISTQPPILSQPPLPQRSGIIQKQASVDTVVTGSSSQVQKLSKIKDTESPSQGDAGGRLSTSTLPTSARRVSTTDKKTGDNSESLRQFFTKLLAKPPQKGPQHDKRSNN